MTRIIEQPPDDDFFSPEFVRFLLGSVAILSGLWAAFGVWVVAKGECYSGQCVTGEDALGFAIFFWMWLVAQIPLTLIAFGGFLYLVTSARTHRVAIAFSGVGVVATAALLSVVGIGLWLGA
jgi:hypothetical protein